MNKATWSEIGENQTIAINTITERISIRHRRWTSGQQVEETKDVLVDGYVYTSAVSDAWISGAIGTIMAIVRAKAPFRHIGMGEWI